MASRPPIARPRARADRPRPWSIALVGVGGVVVGLLLVRATLGGGRPRGQAPQIEPSRRAPAATAPSEPDAGRRPDAAESTVPGAETGTAPDAGSASVTDAGSAPPTPPPPSAPAPTETIRPRGVAYLRCDGVPKQSGPIPCPRDEPMEQRVWAAIDGALARCGGRLGGPGDADVRLYFRGEEPNELRLHEGRTELDGPQLLGCLEDPLDGVQTSLEPELMVVPFRFHLGTPP